jgi:hypothetical protein
MDHILNWIDFFAETGPAVRTLIVHLIGICCLAGGLILLLWGRPIRRLTMGLVTAGIGAALGYYLWQYFQLPLWAPPSIGAVVLGTVGALLAPLLWAVVAAGGVAASATVILLVIHYPHPNPSLGRPLTDAAGTHLLTWLEALGQMSWGALQALASGHPGLFYPVVLGSGVLALVIFVLRTNWAVILVSACLGAKALVAGVVMILLAIHPKLWPALREYCYIPAGVAGLLAIVGMVYQGLGTRKSAGREEEPEDDTSRKESAKANDESRSEKKGRKKKSENAE